MPLHNRLTPLLAADRFPQELTMPELSDAARSRLTAKVLRLLDESFRAHTRGDKATTAGTR